MGTLSGGGTEVISIGERCLIGANAGIGISLGDDCVVEAGCYVTAGTKVTVTDIDGKPKVVKARELSGADNVLFRRNSVTGTVEAVPWRSERRRAQRGPACQLADRSSVLPVRVVGGRAWPSVVGARWSPPRASGRSPTPRAARPTCGGHPRSTCDPEQARNARLIAAVARAPRAARRGRRRSRSRRRTRSPSCATWTTATATRSGSSSSARRRAGAPKAQVRDPYYATNAFYDVLAKIDGYQTMRITEAAQKVQRSGFPEAYGRTRRTPERWRRR